MKHRLDILFLFLSLFVAASANRAWACGGEHTGDGTKPRHETAAKSCCHEPDKIQPLQNTSSAGCDRHAGPDCPCDHDKGACHCPGCGMACHSCAAFALETPLAFATHLFHASAQKRAFYFAEHLPEAVYLPIWQPPKLGV